MKTNVTPRNVTVSASESATFGISNNAKIFRILIDGLYADKIQSITREIWSNALDGHAAAGCTDRPFDVSFPSPFDPTFRVRDYGCSLSHDMVMHMYTDLGHSTKEDTNDAVGKFGIGSKSPFSYTDNFTVTAYLDGEVRFYSAMIGADGVPAIHLMGVQPTEEENGVEVAFPVEKSDTAAFRAAALRVSHGFDVKPNVIGGDNFCGWPDLPVLLQGDGWKLLSGKIEGYKEQAYARMGPVLYPINVDAMGELTSGQRDIMKYTFVIDFPMGDLEMTASREELSYGRNDPTTKAILARVDGIVEGLTERCLESYAECETYFEACAKYRDEIMANQLPMAVKNIIREKATWRGKSLTNSLDFRRVPGMQMMLVNQTRLKYKTQRFSPEYSLTVPADRKTLVMIEDQTGEELKRASTRVRDYIRENRDRFYQIVWVRVEDIPRNCGHMVEFFNRLDGLEIAYVSDMPLPQRMVNARGEYTRRPVQVRRMNSYDFTTKVDLDDEDFEDGGIYVPLLRMNPVTPTGCDNPMVVARLLRALGALDQPVYGAPKSLEKKFTGDQWVNLYDYARDWFAMQELDFAANRARRDAVEAVRRNDKIEFLEENVEHGRLDEDSLIHEAMSLLKQAQEDTTASLANYISLAQGLNVPIEYGSEGVVDPLQKALDRMDALLDDTYPLLDVFARSNVSYISGAVDKVTDYVINCDNESETNHQASLAA